MKLFEKLSNIIRSGTQIFLLIAVIILSFSPVHADNCTWCKRTAVPPECQNLHISSEYFDQLQKWIDCMDQNMSYETFDENDPGFKEALAKCAHLAPENPEEIIYPGSITGRITRLFTCPCFSLGGSQPEYAFEASFNAGLGGKDTFLESGKSKKVNSILTISLYYDGDQRIHVKTWETKSPNNTITSHYGRMFTNSDALLKKDKPIQNLLWQFEQTPKKCQILPEEISVKKEETKEIILTDFSGQGGPSKPFNRVVVKVDVGEILNGEKLSSDPNARVFKVGNGIISVTYKAPDSCKEDEDTLYVYNSCDIAKEALISLSDTKIRDEIAQKKIEIECEWEWTGEITFKRNANVKLSEQVGDEFLKVHRKIKCDLNINCKLKTVYFNKSERKIKHKGNTTAPFTLSANFINESTDKEGMKCVMNFTFPNHSDTIKSTYDPDKKQGGGVTLNIYKDSMTYDLTVFLSTKCMGTATITCGDNGQKEPYEWSIKIIKEFEGQTDGKVISGSWTGPACRYSNATECLLLWPIIPYIFGGEECSTTWSWKLTRIK